MPRYSCSSNQVSLSCPLIKYYRYWLLCREIMEIPLIGPRHVSKQLDCVHTDSNLAENAGPDVCCLGNSVRPLKMPL